MGNCCSSNLQGKEVQQDQNTQGKPKFRIITVRKPKRVPSRQVWEESGSNNSSPIRLSAESFSIPMPPLGKKPSSPTFRRRSGVRLAATLSSTSVKDQNNVSQGMLQIHPLPSCTSTGSLHIPRPPTGMRVASSTSIRRRSGIKLATAGSSSSKADEATTPKVTDALPTSSLEKEVLSQPGESFQVFPSVSASDVAEPSPSKSDVITYEEPLVIDSAKADEQEVTEQTDSAQSSSDFSIANILDEIIAVPSRIDNGPQALELKGSSKYDDKCLFYEQTQSILQTPAQQPESLGPVDATEDSTNDGTATGAQSMEDEKQFLHDIEQKETNEEAFAQPSGLVVSSSVQSDASSPSTSSVTGYATKEPPQKDKVNSMSAIELEIEKTAAFLAIQAIRESLFEETAAMLDTASNMQEAVPKKDMELEQSALVSKEGDKSSSDSSLESSNTEQVIATVATILSVQAIENATLDVGIGQSADGTTACDGTRYQNQSTITSALKPVDEQEKLNDGSNTEEVKAQESDEELVIRGKAILIPKLSQNQIPLSSKSSKEIKKTASTNKNFSSQSPLTKKKTTKPSRSVGTVTKGNATENNKTKTVGQSRSVRTVVKARVNENKMQNRTVGHSRSVGTVATKGRAVETTNTKSQKRLAKVNRSSSLNAVEKPVTGKNGSVTDSKKGSKSVAVNVPKTLTIPRNEYKPKRTENAFIVVKKEQPKKSSLTKDNKQAMALKQGSKSSSSIASSKCVKETRKASSSQNASKSSSQVSSKASLKSQDSNAKLSKTSSLVLTRSKEKKMIDMTGLKPEENTSSSSPGTAVEGKASLISGEAKLPELAEPHQSPNQCVAETDKMGVSSIRGSSSENTRSSSPGISASTNSKCSSPTRSASEKHFQGKTVSKHSPMPNPKLVQSPTRAWLSGTPVKHNSARSSPNVSPRCSSMSNNKTPSPRRSQSPSIGAPKEKISVNRIPTSSPIRIRSGSSKNLQDFPLQESN